MRQKVKKYVAFNIYDTEKDIEIHLDEVKKNGVSYTEYLKDLIKRDMKGVEVMYIYSLTYGNMGDVNEVLELLDKKCNSNGKIILNPTVSRTLDNHFLLNFWSKERIKMKKEKNGKCIDLLIEEKKMIDPLLV